MFWGVPDVGTCRARVAPLYTVAVAGGSTKIASMMKMYKKTVEGSDYASAGNYSYVASALEDRIPLFPSNLPY